MGVTPEGLADVYPRLYHMAEGGTWGSILKHGLLSTSSLLTLFEVDDGTRNEIEARRRPESVPITHARHGRAVVRDQKPLIQSKLLRSLRGCTPEEWYRLLNSRVFFWLTEDRLKTLLCAREYAGKEHTVLTVDTLALVNAYQERVTLAPMNTGNTQPFAHPRGPDTLMRMQDYPFEEREKCGCDGRVVELAVEGGVPDVAKYTLKVATMKCTGKNVEAITLLFKR
jgi:hypothetical protein